MTANKKEMSFEEAFHQLEALAERLESGEAPLEESIQIYEQGMELLKLCSLKLEAAELKLQKLVRDDGGAFQLELMD